MVKPKYTPKRLPRKMKKRFKNKNLEINYNHLEVILVQHGFKVSKMRGLVTWINPETNIKVTFKDGFGELPRKQFVPRMLKALNMHLKKVNRIKTNSLGIKLLRNGFKVINKDNAIKYIHPETKVEISFSSNTPKKKAEAIMKTALKTHLKINKKKIEK